VHNVHRTSARQRTSYERVAAALQSWTGDNVRSPTSVEGGRQETVSHDERKHLPLLACDVNDKFGIVSQIADEATPGRKTLCSGGSLES